ncbi:MAG: 30S ribosomal protein S11 [Candidatus Paceibacterota bacterium]
MGKKRIAQKSGDGKAKKAASGGSVQAPRKKLDTGRLHVEATYNNTKVHLSDTKGNVVCWSSSGALGFNGARKGTPYAAAKVGEVIGDLARQMGVKDVNVAITGVGSGRESAVRGFVSKGINIVSIEDRTPVPHNGPRPPKPRRV